MILLGTFLLSLPISASSGNSTRFTDALFTATSSVCVIGLVVVDTNVYWSMFGKVVISAPTPASWIGKTLGNLGVRSRHGINILAVKGSNNTNIIPDADTVIESDSIITVMGMNSDLKRFRNVK